MVKNKPYTIYGPYGKEWPLDWVLGAVGPGWSKIVQRLIRDLFAMGWDGQLGQIKEKFGGLRFYIYGNQEMQNRVMRAESESFRTCEWCGEPGKRDNDSYWILTLCEKCKEERHALERRGN